MTVQVSKNFKKMTIKSIFAIVLFVITYLLLLLSAIVITILCIAGGIALIALKPMVITIGLGVGLASLGVFVLIFLFKFLFKKHKIDRSHLIEINKTDEPQLFDFISKIVDEVQTDFPKKVYLSSDVNASVFYDSSFWSMIFPVKKNLQIGLGLVNTITQQEFKAILAHEFGHFSQRSMKIGSYVYNVNQVIFNMLYENDSFDVIMQKWANVSGYFSIFVLFAMKIIQSIQWILKKIYNVVNINYMGLSREMEFHADQIAANVAGYVPLKESLLRMDLANQSYNSVLEFYENLKETTLKSNNIYKEQEFVMSFLAKESKLNFKHNLPLVTEYDINKYNKSKLVLKDQWASHPTDEQRILALEKMNIQKQEYIDTPAIALFSDYNKTQENTTHKVFDAASYPDDAQTIDFEKFKQDYTNLFYKNSFPKAYNGYYNSKNPIKYDFHISNDFNTNENLETLFSNEKTDMIYEYISLENDRNIILAIANNEYKVKSFDYDGRKFSNKQAEALAKTIENKIQQVKESIDTNDKNIYCFFMEKALKNGTIDTFKENYDNLIRKDKEYDNKIEIYNNLINSTSFINVVTPFSQIENNFKSIVKLEEDLKNQINLILKNEKLHSEISKESRENFEKYVSKKLLYFDGEAYHNENLKIFFTALGDFYNVFSREYIVSKQDLLSYQIQQL